MEMKKSQTRIKGEKIWDGDEDELDKNQGEEEFEGSSKVKDTVGSLTGELGGGGDRQKSWKLMLKELQNRAVSSRVLELRQ